MAEQLGFIGVGTMGAPIVGHLVRAGYTVQAYDPAPAALAHATAAGARAAGSAGEAAAGSAVVLVAVSNQDVLGEVLQGAGGVLDRAAPGAVIVDLGTTSPPRSRAYAQAAQERGMDYLDAPLSGSVPWASEARLTVMVGGRQETYERCLPIFRTFGRQIFHLGEAGSGQTVKLCHQLAFMALLVGLSEAVAMGERCGLEGTKILEVLDACIAPRHVTEFMRPRLAQRPLPPAASGIGLFKKDLQAVMELARVDAGLELALGGTLLELFEQAVAAGFQNQDPFGLSELVEQGVFKRPMPRGEG